MKGNFSPGRWIELILLGAMGAALCIAVFGDNGLMRLYDLRRQRNELLSEIRAFKEQNSDLERRVELLLHDERYLERIAREELGLIGPNEIVFRFSQITPSADKKKAKVGIKLSPP